MESENVLTVNSVRVYCDLSLGEKTIKIPKAIDIENTQHFIRKDSICHRTIVLSLANYTILRSDDEYIHVSVDVWNKLNLDFDGDLMYTFGSKK